MSNKTVYSFSYNTAILVVIIFVLSYAARTHVCSVIKSAVNCIDPGACPGIRKRGGPKSESLFFFFFCFSIFQGGAPAQKLAEKMTISTEKVAKYR